MRSDAEPSALWARMAGDIGTENEEFFGGARQTINRVREALVRNQSALGEADAACRRLAGRTPSTAPVSEWAGVSARSTDVLEAITTITQERRAQRSIGLTAAAAAEQAYEVTTAPDLPPQWLEEVAGRFAALDSAALADLAAVPGRSLDGLVHLIRGYRGEQLVLEALSAGKLPLPPGATDVSLAGETNTEALDLVIGLADGTAVAAQVKVSSSGALLHEHFAKHPDVDVIYASTDAADAVRDTAAETGITVIGAGDSWPDLGGPVVVDMGFTSMELEATAEHALAAAASVGGDDVLGEVVEAVPLLALGLIALRGARRWRRSGTSNAEIRSRAFDEAKSVITNAGAGEAVAFITSADAVAAPVTIATALLRRSWRRSAGSIQQSTSRIETVRQAVEAVNRSRHEDP